jgi:hypothetical protein
MEYDHWGGSVVTTSPSADGVTVCVECGLAFIHPERGYSTIDPSDIPGRRRIV